MGVTGTYRIVVDRLCFPSFKQHSVCICIIQAMYVCIYIDIFLCSSCTNYLSFSISHL